MKKKTIYQMIVDKSGSMSNSRSQVISGFNEQLSSIQAIQAQYPNQEILMALRFFNETVDQNVVEHTQVGAIEPLHPNQYAPNGFTALLDAIGKSIYDIKIKFGHEIQSDQTTVVMIIITDGEENMSKFYTFDDIKRMISELEATESWNFTFMGADLDAIQVAAKMGIDRKNTLSFDKEDYTHVSKQYFADAAEVYASHKDKNIKSKEFFSIFKTKDIRKK